MTKRRAKKRMPLVEDFNLDEIFPEDVRDQLMKPKRQRTQYNQQTATQRHLDNEINSKMSDTTDDNDSVLAQRTLSHLTPAIALQKVE
jgi:hypothetical protein